MQQRLWFTTPTKSPVVPSYAGYVGGFPSFVYEKSNEIPMSLCSPFVSHIRRMIAPAGEKVYGLAYTIRAFGTDCSGPEVEFEKLPSVAQPILATSHFSSAAGAVDIGAPQLGQLGALSEISRAQSGQLIRAIIDAPVRFRRGEGIKRNPKFREISAERSNRNGLLVGGHMGWRIGQGRVHS